MPAFYYAPSGLFGRKKGQSRKFTARDIAHAQQKIQRLSDRTGKRFSLWYSKDLRNPTRQSSLPVGKLVTVKAKRLKNGRIELYRA